MEETKPSTTTSGILQVRLVPQDGSDELHIKAKPTTQVKRLIDAFAKERNLSSSRLRVIHEGQTLPTESTLGDCGISDGDSLEITVEQLGG